MTIEVVTGRHPVGGAPVRVEVDTATGRIVGVRPAVPDDGDWWVSPGFIDLQVNGFLGSDVNAPTPDPAATTAITAALAELGVTTWCPTVITGPPSDMLARLRAVGEARRRDARTQIAVPAVHVEGPFLSAADGARGVHDPEQIRPVDLAEIDAWCDLVPVAMITLSPHDDRTVAAIPEIVARGIVVALGHTTASPAQIGAAVAAGATVSTHLGNGIAAMLPRHPNPLWSQLADDRLAAGLIADGHHLPVEVLEVMLRAKGRGRAFLVSDATELAGRPPGRYRTTVGGTVELSADGRLAHPGSELLAGAAAPVTTGLRTVVSRTSLSLPEALPLVTTVPAGLLGRHGSGRGVLRVGARGDLVLVDDRGVVRRVMIGGRWLDGR